MIRRVARLAALAASVLAVLGCTGKDSRPAEPPPPRQTTTVEVSYDDLLNQKHIARQVSLSPGDTLRVVLASNASTGYRWAAQTQISDSAVLTQTGHQTVAPVDGRPGASGTEVWTFDALKPGAATLTTTYGQPWPGGTKDARTFSAAVTVR